jgi:pSer/pThr/pTyr-binding forkhead associated (FHA) protein
MSELTLFLVRVGFLALLWLFVLVAFGVVRSDLFGARAQKVAARAAPKRPRQRQPARAHGKTPRKLVVVQGSLAGTAIGLADAPVTIGRGNDSTLVITDDYASTRHARIFPRDGQWLVEDLGSTNGTYLDRVRISGPTPVPTGVPIRIGKTVLELRR